MISIYRIAAPLVALVTFSIVQSLPANAGDISEHQTKLNGGYYLLHKLGDNESQLPILFDFKHSPKEIQDFADQLSKLGKETESDIEEMHDHDSVLRYDANPLPDIEQKTRDSISSEKAHLLLFGSSGNEFVRAFLVSQIEATNYAGNLGKVLAKEESNSSRAGKLQHLSTKWLALREKAYRFLRDY